MNRDRQILIVSLVVLVLVSAGAYMALAQPGFMPGSRVTGTSSSSAETPYGESIEISVGAGSETSGAASWFQRNPEAVASWFASYSDSDSQDVYEVNNTYKSQEQVTIEADLAVTHSNIDDLTATVKVKAVDKGTPANEHEYTLANSADIYAGSPTSDSWDTTPSISAHLTSVGGSTTDETVQYQIYCQVTATGSISGDTLTATISYTPYGTLHYEQSSESSDASVTPSISVSSFFDTGDTIVGAPQGTMLYLTCNLIVAASVYVIISKAYLDR